MARRRMLAACAMLVALLAGGEVFAQAPEKAQPPEPEAITDVRLVKIHRICVQTFGADALGAQVQEMVIARLFQARRFSMTEDCDKADFILKGSIGERSEYATRSESEGIGFGTSGSFSSRDGRTGSRDSASAAGHGNAQESFSSSEVKQEATVTLRVVDRDGEILWATSQDSGEGKSKGAIAMAAEQAVRRLIKDIERAEKQAKASSPPPQE